MEWKCGVSTEYTQSNCKYGAVKSYEEDGICVCKNKDKCNTKTATTKTDQKSGSESLNASTVLAFAIAAVAFMSKIIY
jgi:hypothetical protein